jgi:transposase
LFSILSSEHAMFPETILPDRDSLSLQSVTCEGDTLVVVVHARRVAVPCPACAEVTSEVHSRYWRTLADLPCIGQSVRVRLHTRRWFCRNARCTRRIFTERLPAVAAPHAQRTARLAALVVAVAVAHGGEAGARTLQALGVSLRGATLLTALRRTPPPAATAPSVLGVDDWAWRKGRVYGTILVDLERHAPIALLPDRSATSFGRWLEQHPGVTVICRDREGAYAAGASLGAPNAVQVADRWHLLRNIGDALERMLGHHREALREAARDVDRAADAAATAATEERVEPAAPAVAEPDGATTPEERPHRADEARRAAYQAVLALRDQGLSITAIAAGVGRSRPTVRKYLHADGFPTWAARRRKVEVRPEHAALLRERWMAGCRDAVALHAELRSRSYRGSLRSVQRYVATWRADGPATAPTPPLRPPSPRQVRWWLLQPDEALIPVQRAYLRHLDERCPALRAAQRLAIEFRRLVRDRDHGAFASWLATAESSDLREFRDFAAGLAADRAAVEAALHLEWSNGQTEGQVTKLKMLKRQGYGRAKVDLLLRRLAPAA